MTNENIYKSIFKQNNYYPIFIFDINGKIIDHNYFLNDEFSKNIFSFVSSLSHPIFKIFLNKLKTETHVLKIECLLYFQDDNISSGISSIHKLSNDIFFLIIIKPNKVFKLKNCYTLS